MLPVCGHCQKERPSGSDRFRYFGGSGTQQVSPDSKTLNLVPLGVVAMRGRGSTASNLESLGVAVAWLDDRLTVTTPSAAWGESVDAFGSRLKQACEYINANHEVENLCRELPQRLLTLRQKEGARLKK